MLTRRALLQAGMTAIALLPLRRAALADPLADACRLLPQQELGPYYIADALLRSDIREGKLGVPLDLKLLVLDAGTCRPLKGAAVDLWHCDAGGVYSGFGSASAMPPGGDGQPPGDNMAPPLTPPNARPPSDPLTFLRGIQLTDGDGVATFRTIFPGCYPGRTNHIHFKVRTAGTGDGKPFRGGHVAHTGQVFFPEATAAALMQTGAYAAQRITRTTAAEDGIFGRQDGPASTAKLTSVLSTDPSRGFEAVLIAAVDPTG